MTELPGHLAGLVDNLLEPVIRCEKMERDLLSNVLSENVRVTVERLRTAEPVIASGARAGAIPVLGASSISRREPSPCSLEVGPGSRSADVPGACALLYRVRAPDPFLYRRCSADGSETYGKIPWER